MTRNASIIAVTSGKGGVGKTHISANLGILLAKQSRRTCIIDADHGLANLNLILGIPPINHPSNLFEPNCDLQKVMIHSDLGIDILPSASGISSLSENMEPCREQIQALINRLRTNYDVIIIDTAAGISDSVKHYLEVADHVLLTITSEPTSLTDAFGLIRKMKSVQPFYNIIINRVSNAASATSVYKRFASAVRKYIGAQVGAIGYISEDSFVAAAVLSQTPVVNYSPNCLATQCLKRISRTLSRKILEDVSSNQQAQIKHKPPAEIKSKKNKLKHEKQTPDHLNGLGTETWDKKELLKEQVIEALPASPTFIKNNVEVDPFETWLSQLNQYFNQEGGTEKTRQFRKRRLIDALGKLCDQDPKLLADLESLVVSSSVKNAESILEQTNLANRLARTRFVEEPVIEPSIKRRSLLNPGNRSQGVSKAFSIISKLK